MNVAKEINQYIISQPEPKRGDMQALHQRILQLSPESRLWYYDGKNSENQVVSNPSIGYGLHLAKQANGKTTEWFRIGFSANKTGISVYILGLKDKTFLSKTYAERLGKASVTGYCIKFKSLKDINVDVLEEAIQFGLAQEA